MPRRSELSDVYGFGADLAPGGDHRNGGEPSQAKISLTEGEPTNGESGEHRPRDCQPAWGALLGRARTLWPMLLGRRSRR